MFTGIIECLGEVKEIEQEGTNKTFTISSSITSELKIDQSLAHDGVCLTVVEINADRYKVTAVDETLNKSALHSWKPGTLVNLERAMKLDDRLDGHIVQGHVDIVGICTDRKENDGSWVFRFKYPSSPENNVTVEKGSITINGVSLTVFDSDENSFAVTIIPYTYQHTGFKNLKTGDQVNLEFDIVGKYIARLTKF